jgi:DNA-directed RNA polymerase subunit M
MEFCPNCERKLFPSTEASESTSRVQLKCIRCGYIQDDVLQTALANNNAKPISNVVTVIDNKDELQTMPTTRRECPHCDNTLAFYWQVQTRAGDEGSTQFFRCTQCRHTWRLYT